MAFPRIESNRSFEWVLTISYFIFFLMNDFCICLPSPHKAKSECWRRYNRCREWKGWLYQPMADSFVHCLGVKWSFRYSHSLFIYLFYIYVEYVNWNGRWWIYLTKPLIDILIINCAVKILSLWCLFCFSVYWFRSILLIVDFDFLKAQICLDGKWWKKLLMLNTELNVD